MSMTDQQKELSLNLLNRMIGLLGLGATAVPKEDPNGFALELKSEDAGRLIGRKGQYLKGLELILNRMLRKQNGDRCPWVALEVEGYERKEARRGARKPRADVARLEKIALDAAKEVKRWGEVQRLGPFNAAERRVIHMTLREDSEVITESEESGSDARKRVLVKLVGTAEG